MNIQYGNKPDINTPINDIRTFIINQVHPDYDAYILANKP